MRHRLEPHLVTLTLGVLLAAPALADSPRLEPGKWEVTTVASNTMRPQKKERTTTECITESQSDPLSVMTGDKDCTVDESSTTNNTLKWKMTCKNNAGVGKGEGEFTSEGKSAHGDMWMEMAIHTQKVRFEISWKGKRIGSCD